MRKSCIEAKVKNRINYTKSTWAVKVEKMKRKFIRIPRNKLNPIWPAFSPEINKKGFFRGSELNPK